ncbi:MAG TPA: hypothetical protein VFH95_00510 [Candidatus Kapabacteria bacterium]|nr:hypothetical protein [Candidatus Kapabacteria bacterium]
MQPNYGRRKQAAGHPIFQSEVAPRVIRLSCDLRNKNILIAGID